LKPHGIGEVEQYRTGVFEGFCLADHFVERLVGHLIPGLGLPSGDM
jgi:hypothetical protein